MSAEPTVGEIAMAALETLYTLGRGLDVLAPDELIRLRVESTGGSVDGLVAVAPTPKSAAILTAAVDLIDLAQGVNEKDLRKFMGMTLGEFNETLERGVPPETP
ncbi:MAG: hypothetical protein AAF196_07625 [Planctomycetota bacterium]